LPLARDQPERLANLVRRNAVATCVPTIDALADAARTLSSDPAALQGLRAQAQTLALRNGLTEALDAIEALLRRPCSPTRGEPRPQAT
jgi:UDP-N-acetylglucosamine:LPS N-acetylglucosamine transferase